MEWVEKKSFLGWLERVYIIDLGHEPLQAITGALCFIFIAFGGTYYVLKDVQNPLYWIIGGACYLVIISIALTTKAIRRLRYFYSLITGVILLIIVALAAYLFQAAGGRK